MLPHPWEQLDFLVLLHGNKTVAASRVNVIYLKRIEEVEQVGNFQFSSLFMYVSLPNSSSLLKKSQGFSLQFILTTHDIVGEATVSRSCANGLCKCSQLLL